MKILVLIREYPPYARGGMGRVVSHLEDFCRSNNWGLTIIANKPGWGIDVENRGTTVVYRVPTLGTTFLTKLPTYCFFASRLVNRLVKDHDLIYSVSSPFSAKTRVPLVVHFQGTRYGEYLACKKLKKPVHAFLNKLYVFFDKIVLEKAAGIIVLSRDMLVEIENSGRFDKKPQIISNGVDIGLFCPFGQRKFDDKEKTVLYVGRLDLRKGIDTLLSAFGEVSRNVKSRLLIVGEGREKERLQKMVERLSLNVKFLGAIPHNDLPAIYNDADLFVLPSLYEGISLAALEAASCGTPVIMSDACVGLGLSKFKAGDSNSLAKIMSEYLPSSRKLDYLSALSLRVSRDYDWGRIIPRIAVYLESFVEYGK
jgi:glycosyltransferase involved in cell wall biosynthesis